MKGKTTIIMPSHERHHLLLRAIDYYSELDFLVLIVDSSEVFLNVKLPENITYMHLPGLLIGDKIYAGLCSVSTHFSCLCADDDFLSENGLKAGQEFLEKNLDYVSVQGHYIQFDPSNPKEQHNPIYEEYIGYKIDSDFIKDRVLKALTAPHIYALHRTFVLKKSINIMLGIVPINILECSISIVGMCYGKHAVLPVFWSARDIVRYSRYQDENETDYRTDEDHNEVNKLNKAVSDIKNFLISSEGNKYQNNFIETVSDVVPDPKEARDLFNLIYNKYLSTVKRKNNIFFKQKLKDIIKLLLPNFIVRKIQINTCDKLRFAVKSVSGYPWSDSVAMKDWDSMIRVILKFRDLK